jgi:hypothetical protein
VNDVVRRELEKDAISRQLNDEMAVWRKTQEKKIGCVTPGMEKHYYREKLIEALLKLKRRGIS